MGTIINRKKHFIEKNMKKLSNYMLYTHDVTYNLSGSNDIYKKDHKTF